MNVIEPSVSLHTPMGILTEFQGTEMLRWIESNARISHRSEFAQTETSWRRFIQAVVLDRGDWSVTEHASVTAVVRTNRGITHEWVRHRLFGFTQESSRFVNYTHKNHEPDFIISVSVKPEDRDEWIADLATIENIYKKWIVRGYAPQIARDHLPNALAATLSVTGNLRNWRHFFLMRTSKESHPDIRRISIPMLKEFQGKIPLLYDDIEAESRQIDNLRKAR